MKTIALLTLLATSYSLQAQRILRFETPDYDFGEIQEVDGPVEHAFVFVNQGMDSLRILGVKASCGCTTPAWTKEVIPPGGEGSITARYNPRNRPGAFRKTLRVSTTNTAANTVLFINGNVKPRPRTIAEDLPTKMGGLRVKYMSFNFGKMTTEKSIVKTFEVYNDTDSALVYLDEKTEGPAYLDIKFSPSEIPPKEKGEIQVTYLADQVGDLGFISSKISLFTSEDDKPKNFNVMATVEEYFPPMSEEELQKAPKLSFNKTSYDFGRAEKNAVLETEFLLTNTGKSPLNLRKVSTNCGCTITSLDKMDVEPGDMATMKVKFDTEKRRGRQYKSITVFSNDPSAPTQMISIRAELPKS